MPGIWCLAAAMQAALVAATGTYNTGYSLERTMIHFVIGSWIILGSTIIFFMQAGFGMLEAGLVQGKNAKNILMKNLLDSAMGAIAYWAFGYAISQGGDEDFMGTRHFFLTDNFENYYLFFFGFSFACTAATVVSGAMAERTRFSAYMIYTVVITAFVHPVVVYWVSSDYGWMSPYRSDPWWGKGFIDYAGGCSVHVVGGFASLAGSFLLGPRNGRFLRQADGSYDSKWAGHNIAFTSLGTFILWYPFNVGSVYVNLERADCSFTDTCAAAINCSGDACSDTWLEFFVPAANRLAGKITVVMTVCGATSGLCSLAIQFFYVGYLDLRGTMNGLLSGLVAISAGCGVVEPWAGFVIGVLAAFTYTHTARLMIYLHIDDPLDAFPVHGASGAVGVICVGLFMSKEGFKDGYFRLDQGLSGLFYGGGFEQLGIQTVGVIAVISWTLAIITLTFQFLRHAPKLFPKLYAEPDGEIAVSGLRVSYVCEEYGADFLHHGGSAYPEFSKNLVDPDIEFFSLDVNGVSHIAELHVKIGRVKFFLRSDNSVHQWEQFEDMSSCSLAIENKLEMTITFGSSESKRLIRFHSSTKRQRMYDVAMYNHFNGAQRAPGYRVAKARVWTGSWNMGNCPTPANLHAWFDFHKINGQDWDFICIGVQEARWSNVTANEQDTANLLEACDAAVGDSFYRLSEKAMFEIKGAVYMNRRHVNFVSNVTSTYQPTGIAGLGYNKGGVMFCFTFYESHFAFVNTHLAAHMEKTKARNEDAKNILHATMDYSFGRPKMDMSNQFDVVWFMGDMNYRLEGTTFASCVAEVKAAVANGNWSSLWAKDQYIREHADNKVLYGFDTFDMNFPPTYKYFRTEDVQKGRCDAGNLHEQIIEPAGSIRTSRVYTEEKSRPPAWCDRILWRTLDQAHCADASESRRRSLVLMGYGPVEEVVSSDHSPVVATFEANVLLPYIPTSIEDTQQALVWLSGLKVTGLDKHSSLVLRLSSDCLAQDFMTPVASQNGAKEHVWPDELVETRSSKHLKCKHLDPLLCLYSDPERLKSQYLFVNVLTTGVTTDTAVGCTNVSLWDFVESSLGQGTADNNRHGFVCKLSCCGIQAGEVSGSIQFHWLEKQQGIIEKRGMQTGECDEKHRERPEMQKLLSSDDLGSPQPMSPSKSR